MSYQKKIGDLGEKLAKKFLIGKGYKIIQENFKVRKGEIDIIGRQGKKLVFIEVKTRTNSAFGYPEEALTYTKKQRIRRAALRYLLKTGYNDPWQVELVAIELNQRLNRAEIRHYQDIDLG